MGDLPVRLIIKKRIVEVLEGIDNGAFKDRVFRGRAIFGDDDPIPMISVLEPPIPLETIRSAAENPNQAGRWELLVQGWPKDDKKNPTDPADMLLAKVKAALAAERRRDRSMNILGLKNMVTDLHIGHGASRPSDEVSVRAYFWLIITLKIVEDMSDPFPDV